jgi:integrase
MKNYYKIRGTFPQVYQFQAHNGELYYMVSARSKKWGLNIRKTFTTEKKALDYAREISDGLVQNGKTEVPSKDFALYSRLEEKLKPYAKTIADAVDHYLTFLGLEVIRNAVPPVKELVQQWETEKLTDKLRPLSRKTEYELKSYSRFLTRTWGDRKPMDVTQKEIRKVLNDLDVSNNSRQKYFRFIRMFFLWAKDRHFMKGYENPTDGIRIRMTQYEASFYSVETITTLLKLVRKDYPSMLGYYSLLTFAGLRPSEGTRVQWDDINFITAEIYVRRGKKQARRFILHPTALEWLKTLPKDQPLVPVKNLANLEKKIRPSIGVEWIQDGLRHGFATYYNALVQDPYKVANVLGDNIQTVRRHYMRSVAKDDMERFWGLTPNKVQ